MHRVAVGRRGEHQGDLAAHVLGQLVEPAGVAGDHPAAAPRALAGRQRQVGPGHLEIVDDSNRVRVEIGELAVPGTHDIAGFGITLRGPNGSVRADMTEDASGARLAFLSSGDPALELLPGLRRIAGRVARLLAVPWNRAKVARRAEMACAGRMGSRPVLGGTLRRRRYRAECRLVRQPSWSPSPIPPPPRRPAARR